jgi:hypothetical protein
VLVEAVDERTCIIDVGSDTPQMLAAHLGMLDVDFEVDGPPSSSSSWTGWPTGTGARSPGRVGSAPPLISSLSR